MTNNTSSLESRDFCNCSLIVTLQSQGGVHQIPIPISAETPGSLSVAVNGFNFSDDVELIDTSMSEEIDVLTTSQKWLTMESQYSVTGSNPGLVRLDVEGEINSATWLIPSGGGSPIGQGDSHLIELHPNYPINLSYNGDIVDAEVTFRIKQSWDDEYYLKMSTRIVLSNGVMSMPATHAWGSIGGNQKALENDMEIKSVTFSDSRGTLSVDEYYLMAGQSLDISVDIGFENINHDTPQYSSYFLVTATLSFGVRLFSFVSTKSPKLSPNIITIL